MSNDSSERGPDSQPDPTPVDRYEPPAPRDDGMDRFDAGDPFRAEPSADTIVIREKS